MQDLLEQFTFILRKINFFQEIPQTLKSQN